VLRSVLGTLGLLALFVAAIVGMLAAFGAFGEKAPTAPAASTVVGLEAMPEQTTQIAGTASEADVGETVTAGDVSWTVTDAGQEREIHKYTFPPETLRGDFVTMDFSAKNGTEHPITLTGETITLVDDEGNEFRPKPDRNDAFVEPDRNLLFSETGILEPGDTKEGRVNFEVLPDSSGFRARLGGTDTNASEGRYVNLGF
jgi:hypothetical protein